MLTDPRIDAYIAKSAAFAQPILIRFRAAVHAAVPDAVETIKWGMPHFTLNGGILAGMAAFKAHAALIVEGVGQRGGMDGAGMGHYGKIASIEACPSPAELEARLAAAAKALPEKKKAARMQRPAKPELPMPDDLGAVLTQAARAIFDGFAPSHRREYTEWIVEAKRPETRAKRVAQAGEWLAQGKKRNWKYGRY